RKEANVPVCKQGQAASVVEEARHMRTSEAGMRVGRVVLQVYRLRPDDRVIFVGLGNEDGCSWIAHDQPAAPSRSWGEGGDVALGEQVGGQAVRRLLAPSRARTAVGFRHL